MIPLLVDDEVSIQRALVPFYAQKRMRWMNYSKLLWGWIVLNKVDLVEKAKLLTLAQAVNVRARFEATFMVSALSGDGVPDVRRWLAEPSTRAVITTGGTGVSRRDGTFEAVDSLLQKRLDGFGEIFRALSFAEIGPAAMLRDR